MQNFNFSMPTEIIFGKETENNIGSTLRKYSDAKKVLIVYGSDRIKRTGLFDRVSSSLEKEGMSVYELGGVVANPRLSLVYEGIDLVKKEGIEFIVAIGGGSPIDTAKAIAVGSLSDEDVWEFFEGKTITKALPVGCVLTIPAAGSEASISSVITNEDGGLKRSINSEIILPKFAIMNPELTLTLPKYQIGCGVTDMLAHVMERYFTNTSNVLVTDELCEAIMRTIVSAGLKSYEDPENYDHRAEIMLAGTLAHNGLLDLGRADDWATHRIAAEIGGLYDTAHGATLSIIFPHWMKYVLNHDVNRMVQFAHNVFGVEMHGTSEEIALEGIARLQEFYKKLGMPICFKDANIPSDQLELMADKATNNDTCTVGNYVKLHKKDLIEIYKMSL